MSVNDVIILLKERSNPEYLAGMKRFGIADQYALGIPVPEVRKIARLIKKDHALALELWKTKIHEARILASLVADPLLFTAEQADDWVNDFYSWDVCDQVCGNLIDRTAFAIEKALTYSTSEHEFVKRAAFVIMAEYAIHQKDAADAVFISLLPVIEREAGDERNFVKKAVNWALRQIGKRNALLRIEAIKTAQNILAQNTRSARWVASNALIELAGKSTIINS